MTPYLLPIIAMLGMWRLYVAFLDRIKAPVPWTDAQREFYRPRIEAEQQRLLNRR